MSYDFNDLINQSAQATGRFSSNMYNQFSDSMIDKFKVSTRFDRVFDKEVVSFQEYTPSEKEKYASYIDELLSDFPKNDNYYKSQKAIVNIFYKDFNHAMANMQYRDLLHFASRIRLSLSKSDLELLKKLVTSNPDIDIEQLITKYIDNYAIEESLFNFTILLYLISIRYLRLVDCDRLNQ